MYQVQKCSIVLLLFILSTQAKCEEVLWHSTKNIKLLKIIENHFISIDFDASQNWGFFAFERFRSWMCFVQLNISILILSEYYWLMFGFISLSEDRMRCGCDEYEWANCRRCCSQLSTLSMASDNVLQRRIELWRFAYQQSLRCDGRPLCIRHDWWKLGIGDRSTACPKS